MSYFPMKKDVPLSIIEKVMKLYPDYLLVWNSITDVELINYMMLGLGVTVPILDSLLYARNNLPQHEKLTNKNLRHNYLYKKEGDLHIFLFIQKRYRRGILYYDIEQFRCDETRKTLDVLLRIEGDTERIRDASPERK